MPLCFRVWRLPFTWGFVNGRTLHVSSAPLPSPAPPTGLKTEAESFGALLEEAQTLSDTMEQWGVIGNPHTPETILSLRAVNDALSKARCGARRAHGTVGMCGRACM